MDLPLNSPYLLEQFERNILINPIISIIVLNLLAEILQGENISAVSTIVQRFETINSFKLLNDLVNGTSKKINKIEEIRKIEGSDFGCPIYGFNDSIINFLSRLFFRYHKDHKKLSDLFRLFEESGLD